ncbi:hypothetical protein VHEMI09117 [[Torrubiella] hemipterigena]|uniref:Shikimate dehydrogenase substrate binding N-terminal domain-containing protein n=1 Tax=[Torrubiella] hemipterigena TaxID=1531966 RepID=A0A0A1T8T8_9HYPO|nr:hypothetical protein VHEMI09117 [[Torrubiella] hemipterigena]
MNASSEPQPEKHRKKVGYLFGKKITHSLSPPFHQAVYDHFDLNWEQLRLDSADIDEFLRLTKQPNFYGAAVTMPNKVAILPYLDGMTEECRDVGACNTIFLKQKDGRRQLYGTNTDVIGIRDSFLRNVPHPASSIHGRPALVVGGGGAARSAIYALRKSMNVTHIYLVNRDAQEVEDMMKDCTLRGYGQDLVHIQTEEQARLAETPGAIVACVPDFEPQSHEEKMARSILHILLSGPMLGVMLEMCYNPTPFTKLAALAEGLGWSIILGTEAMIWQGLEQDKYWTGRKVEDMPIEKLQALVDREIQRQRLDRL